MALQMSDTVRSAMLNAIVDAVGSGATLEVRTGSAPATCATADSGTVLITVSLPTAWLGTASAGIVTLAGSWTDASADATGSAGHFRIKDSGGTCHFQGKCGSTGDSTAQMTASSVSVVEGLGAEVTAFTLEAGNR